MYGRCQCSLSHTPHVANVFPRSWQFAVDSDGAAIGEASDHCNGSPLQLNAIGPQGCCRLAQRGFLISCLWLWCNSEQQLSCNSKHTPYTHCTTELVLFSVKDLLASAQSRHASGSEYSPRSWLLAQLPHKPRDVQVVIKPAASAASRRRLR